MHAPRRIGLLFVLMIVIANRHQVSAQDNDSIKKSDMSLAEANAEIIEMTDKGFGVVGLRVMVKGKEPQYEVDFQRGSPAFHCQLACSRATLGQELRGANMRGGVRHIAIIGFNIGNDPRFVVLSHLFEPGRPSTQKILLDVPALEFAREVDRERKLGGRLVQKSTYKDPMGRDLHTAIFEPR